MNISYDQAYLKGLSFVQTGEFEKAEPFFEYVGDPPIDCESLTMDLANQWLRKIKLFLKHRELLDFDILKRDARLEIHRLGTDNLAINTDDIDF